MALVLGENLTYHAIGRIVGQSRAIIEFRGGQLGRAFVSVANGFGDLEEADAQALAEAIREKNKWYRLSGEKGEGYSIVPVDRTDAPARVYNQTTLSNGDGLSITREGDIATGVVHAIHGARLPQEDAENLKRTLEMQPGVGVRLSHGMTIIDGPRGSGIQVVTIFDTSIDKKDMGKPITTIQNDKFL